MRWGWPLLPGKSNKKIGEGLKLYQGKVKVRY